MRHPEPVPACSSFWFPRGALMEEAHTRSQVSCKDTGTQSRSDHSCLDKRVKVKVAQSCLTPSNRRLRGRGCANCQSLPQAELFVRQSV